MKCAPAVIRRPERDLRLRALAGELPGIAQEILERDLEQGRITLRRQRVRQRDVDLAIGISPAELRQQCSFVGRQVHPLKSLRHADDGAGRHILKAKRANAAADTSALEREIDERVYRLYDLTPDEIRIVEET